MCVCEREKERESVREGIVCMVVRLVNDTGQSRKMHLKGVMHSKKQTRKTSVSQKA